MDDCSLDSLDDLTVKTPVFESTAISASQVLKRPQQTFTEHSKYQPWAHETGCSGDEREHATPNREDDLIDDDFFEQSSVSQSDCVNIKGTRTLSQSFCPLSSEFSPREDIETCKLIAYTQSSLSCAPPQATVTEDRTVRDDCDDESSLKHNMSEHTPNSFNSKMSPKTEHWSDCSKHVVSTSNIHDANVSTSPIPGFPISPSFKPSPVIKSRIDPGTHTFEEIKMAEISMLHIADDVPPPITSSKIKAEKGIILDKE